MKKMMILAAIVCAASFCHAAKAQWNITTSKNAGIAYDGATVYYVLSSDVTDFANEAAIVAVAKQSAKLASSTMSGGTGNQYANSWVAEGATYNWKAVVVSDGKYYVSAEGTMVAVADTATPTTSSIKTGTAMETAGNWKSFSGGDVPEPTSAMLILLGVAGLALRRRV